MIEFDTFTPVVGDLEKPEDAGQGEAGQVKLWLKALDLADKEEENWRKRATEVVKFYRDASTSNDAENRKFKYNILYSNTETMAPALFNSDPIPDIRRRFGEADPVAKIASTVLERVISYSIDQYDLTHCMKSAVKDYLLPGRAVTRVRYKPYMEERFKRVSVISGANGYTLADGTPLPNEAEATGGVEPQARSAPEIKTDQSGSYIDGEAYEDVSYEETYAEHVQWADFRRGPGKIWDEVPWVAFRHNLTRDEIKKLNPEVGATIQLDGSIEPDDKPKDSAPAPDIFKRGTVWEIWDKTTKRVFFIAPAYKQAPLKTQEDPFNLNGFFPIPRPLYAVENPETLVPVELFRLYRSQAEELDTLTRRLTALTKVMKWRGLYATTEDGTAYMDQMRNALDGDLVPSQSAYAFAQNGGIANYIWLMPLEQLSQVIDKLSLRVEQVKNNIYEIMGIADILRGSTQASETLGAQQIKAQWGSLRLSNMQNEVQRYARDLFRIMSEIVAEKFSAPTLEKMTGLELPMDKEEIAKKAALSGQQVTPEMLAMPTWADVMALLKNDALRCFRIDIETDSTIQADQQRFQKNLAEFATSIGPMSQGLIQMAEAGMLPPEAGVAFMQALARGFKLPRQAMDALDSAGKQPPKQDGAEQAKVQAEQMKLQGEQARTQADIQKTQLDGQIAQMKAQTEQQKLIMEAQFMSEEHALKMEELRFKHQATMTELAAKASAKPETMQ